MSGKSTLVSLPTEAQQWGEIRAWPTAHLAPVIESNSDLVLLQPELPSDGLLGCRLRPLQGVFLQAVSYASLPACLSAFSSLLQDHHFAEAQKLLSVYFAPAPFSAAASASTLLARLSGWASKWQVVVWLSTFPNRAPTANPTWACGYPKVFPLPPQPLRQLPHLFLCGQRSSGSAAGDYVGLGEGACAPRRACQLRPGAHRAPSGPGIHMAGVLEEAPIH